MDQAGKVLNMRIKIDVWSKGLAKEVREDKLRVMFCEQIPPTRVWLYLKRVRFMFRRGKTGGKTGDLTQVERALFEEQGAEDVIVDGQCSWQTSGIRLLVLVLTMI